jgi:hypothetical protein
VKEKKSKRKALECLGIAGLLLLLCSCVSFDIGDWPSRFVYPHNEPSANLCGPIGAFCAYYLLYYIGPGVLVILASGICCLVVRLTHRPIGQGVFRAFGLVLLTVAASSSFYCLWPYRVFGFPMGSGGVLGVAAVTFLRSHFAWLGTFILITATWLVGILLLADSFFLLVFAGSRVVLRKVAGMAVPAWSAAKEHSEVLSEIWQKLSAKQRKTPAAAQALRFDRDVGSEQRPESAAGAAGSAEPGHSKLTPPQVEKRCRLWSCWLSRNTVLLRCRKRS